MIMNISILMLLIGISFCPVYTVLFLKYRKKSNSLIKDFFRVYLDAKLIMAFLLLLFGLFFLLTFGNIFGKAMSKMLIISNLISLFSIHFIHFTIIKFRFKVMDNIENELKLINSTAMVNEFRIKRFYRIKVDFLMVFAIVSICVLFIVGFLTYKEINVQGEKNLSVHQTLTLIGDISTPAENLLETYFTVLQLTEETDPAEVNRLLKECERTKENYIIRHKEWEITLEDNFMKSLLIKKSYESAVVFFRILTNEFAPLIEGGKREEAKEIAYKKLKILYKEHEKVINELLMMANLKIKADINSQNDLEKEKLKEIFIIGVSILSILMFCWVFITENTIINIHKIEKIKVTGG